MHNLEVYMAMLSEAGASTINGDDAEKMLAKELSMLRNKKCCPWAFASKKSSSSSTKLKKAAKKEKKDKKPKAKPAKSKSKVKRSKPDASDSASESSRSSSSNSSSSSDDSTKHTPPKRTRKAPVAVPQKTLSPPPTDAAEKTLVQPLPLHVDKPLPVDQPIDPRTGAAALGAVAPPPPMTAQAIELAEQLRVERAQHAETYQRLQELAAQHAADEERISQLAHQLSEAKSEAIAREKDRTELLIRLGTTEGAKAALETTNKQLMDMLMKQH